MEKQPTREPGFEFVPLYPAVNQTKVWQRDVQETAMAVTRHVQLPVSSTYITINAQGKEELNPKLSHL